MVLIQKFLTADGSINVFFFFFFGNLSLSIIGSASLVQ